MNFNTDGFNERSNYIHNSNDINRLNRSATSNSDSSFAKMRIEERRNLVETVDTDKKEYVEEARGSKDNFILRNNTMRNINARPNLNNPVSNALHRNLFKK